MSRLLSSVTNFYFNCPHYFDPTVSGEQVGGITIDEFAVKIGGWACLKNAKFYLRVWGEADIADSFRCQVRVYVNDVFSGNVSYAYCNNSVDIEPLYGDWGLDLGGQVNSETRIKLVPQVVGPVATVATSAKLFACLTAVQPGVVHEK